MIRINNMENISRVRLEWGTQTLCYETSRDERMSTALRTPYIIIMVVVFLNLSYEIQIGHINKTYCSGKFRNYGSLDGHFRKS